MTLADETVVTLRRLADELEGRGGTKLPPEREIAERLGVSRATVRRAIDLLAREGRIRRVVGRTGGAYLVRSSGVEITGFELPSGRRLARDLNTVRGVPEMLTLQGFVEGTRVVEARLVPANGMVARALEVDAETEVLSLLRVRFADADTLSLDHAYVTLGRKMIGCDFSSSLYATLQDRFGVPIVATDEIIDTVGANERTARLLGVPLEAPLLRLERVGYDARDRPTEYSIDLFRADRTRLRVRTTSSDAEPSSRVRFGYADR
ncbi:GntR family transcriptional regulator [Tsukamurella sputi]|uniref:GntR family transcriptional regulator n=1 Tax=Tsukamurella sputi TaxID=2591848 RepID=A0A5C5RR17_9ACTN|nr:GntR family transcriptional regulator [Tsukamurella sputi]TWS25040.1 GntR family transcriptional regulator [Tsukamurella sputi]